MCGPFTLGTLIVALLIGLICGIALLSFIFWLLMFIDCCGRKFNLGIERLIWLVVLLVSHVLGAFVYYFLIKKCNPEGLLDKEGHLK